MFRFHLSGLAVAAGVLAAAFPCATAQAQSSKVVPVSATTTEGDSSNYMPFVYDVSRTQQVWLGQAVATGAAVLNSINFRRDGNISTSAYAALTIPQHVVSIGHTSVSPSTMSMTYSANITSTMTTIYNGKYSIPALPAPTPPPAPFAIAYPLSTPYVYTTAKGNLLMEWIIGSGQANNKQEFQLDAVTATTGGGGAVRPFGTWGKFAGSDSASWKADAQKLIPGGSADISLAGFNQAYASKLFVGLSDKSWNGLTLPYDLGAIGAPGNTLYTGLDAVIPFTLTQVGTSYGANPIFPLPNDNKLIGFKAFVQGYYADAKANAAGLVASDAIELTIGATGPISRLMGDSNTTMPTGYFHPEPPVVQFVGAIN
jgi:hypothetical protein